MARVIGLVVYGEQRWFTPREAEIFNLLRWHMPAVVDQRLIYRHLYPAAIKDPPLSNVIAVHICRLRTRLKNSGFAIETAAFVGYRLVQDGWPERQEPPCELLLAAN